MKNNIGFLRLQFITSVFLYGTIGYILSFISLPSEIVVLCRGFIGSIVMLLFVKAKGHRLDFSALKANSKWLILSGISLGLNWVFLFAAYRHTTVAVASLCNYMAPIIVIFLSPVLYKEKLTPVKIACVISAFFGIILVSGVFPISDIQNLSLLGIALGLAGAVCFVLLIIFNKKLNNISVFDRAIAQLSLSACTVFPYVLYCNLGKHLELDTKSVLLTLMLGIVHTGVAYYFYFNGLGSLPVMSVAILGYIEPVISILTSALLLAQPMNIYGIVGAVLIIGAAVVSETVGIKASN